MSDISKIKSSRIIDGFQPGDLCYSLRTEKEGWILCDGRAVSRTDYSNLFEAIGTQYGEGDGTTTFNVPNLSGRFLQMDTTKAIGTYVEAGLPNITGSVGYTVGATFGSDGCFTKDNNTNSAWWAGATNVARSSVFHMDASLSSAIYGKSETVQPPSFIVNYFIKY